MPPLGPLRTFSLSRAVGYVEDAGPASPGRRRRCDARSSRGTPGAAERLGAGRGLAGAAGKGRGAGPTSAAEDGRRSAGVASLASAWSGASLTPWPWLR